LARPVDVLINNAGALFDAQRNTSENLDESLVLLLLSPYRLTLGLKPLLLEAASARVINIVSGGMYTQRLDLQGTLQPDPEDYSGSVVYAKAKRALMIVTEEWAEQWRSDGIVVNAMHPGWADTPGVEQSLPGFHRLSRGILRTPAQGADTAVWAAVATEAGEIAGQLLLDRVPRSAYLLPGTRETTEERQRLMQTLNDCSSAADFAALARQSRPDHEGQTS